MKRDVRVRASVGERRHIWRQSLARVGQHRAGLRASCACSTTHPSGVTRRFGVRPSALRYYERIGVIPRAERVNGQRRYDRATLSRLAAVSVAKQAGFTLREIRALLADFTPSKPPRGRWRKLASSKLR